jgi:hypothetical protein
MVADQLPRKSRFRKRQRLRLNSPTIPEGNQSPTHQDNLALTSVAIHLTKRLKRRGATFQLGAKSGRERPARGSGWRCAACLTVAHIDRTWPECIRPSCSVFSATDPILCGCFSTFRHGANSTAWVRCRVERNGNGRRVKVPQCSLHWTAKPVARSRPASGKLERRDCGTRRSSRICCGAGETLAALADFDNSHRRWGQGTVQITLQPCRKNLLRIDSQRL